MPNRWMDDRERRWRGRASRERPDPRRGGNERETDDSWREDRSFQAEARPDRDRLAGDRGSDETYGDDDLDQDLYRWRRPPTRLEHSYFGFGHDLRGAEYELRHARGEHNAPNPREGRHEGGRNWWDRTRDEVSAWFGDHDAERRRRWDAQASHRGRGPKGYRRSDERISEEVHDRLTDDPWLDATNIEVTVSAGEVVLAGTVMNREDKHRAERIIEDLSGVGHVQNNLRVETPPPPGR